MARRPPLAVRALRNLSAITRSSEWGDSSIPAPSASAFASALSGVGDGAGALAISTVYSCVKVLYDDFVSLPFRAYTGDPLGSRGVAPIQPLIVREPFGPDLAPSEGIAQLVASRAMRGAWYCEVVSYDRAGYPEQLKILHPDKVRPEWSPGGRLQFRVGYSTIYDTTKVITGRGLTMPGSAAPLDPLTANRITWALAMHAIEYADSYFEEGGDSSGVISVPGVVTRDKARLIRDLWQTGAQPHVPHVLSGGATWAAMTVTPENAQFLETRRFSREDICGIFGVPPQRIQAIVENASQGGGKGVDSIDHGYVTHTLLPIAAGIERNWDRMIPGDAASWTGFDWDALLKAAALERAMIAQIHRTTGVRPSNEIRASEGWQRIEDPRMDDPFQPLNSNTASSGGADNAPAPGTIPGSTTSGGD